MGASVVETTAVVMAGIKPSMIMVATGIVVVMMVIAVVMVMREAVIHAGIREKDIARTSGWISRITGSAHTHDGDEDDHSDHHQYEEWFNHGLSLLFGNHLPI